MKCRAMWWDALNIKHRHAPTRYQTPKSSVLWAGLLATTQGRVELDMTAILHRPSLFDAKEMYDACPGLKHYKCIKFTHSYSINWFTPFFRIFDHNESLECKIFELVMNAKSHILHGSWNTREKIDCGRISILLSQGTPYYLFNFPKFEREVVTALSCVS